MRSSRGNLTRVCVWLLGAVSLITACPLPALGQETQPERSPRSELAAIYVVQSDKRILFSWHCSSVQTGPNMLAEDSILIRKGTAGTPS